MPTLCLLRMNIRYTRLRIFGFVANCLYFVKFQGFTDIRQTLRREISQYPVASACCFLSEKQRSQNNSAYKMQPNLAIDHRILTNLYSDTHTNIWLPVIFLLTEISRYKSQNFLRQGARIVLDFEGQGCICSQGSLPVRIWPRKRALETYCG